MLFQYSTGMFLAGPAVLFLRLIVISVACDKPSVWNLVTFLVGCLIWHRYSIPTSRIVFLIWLALLWVFATQGEYILSYLPQLFSMVFKAFCCSWANQCILSFPQNVLNGCFGHSLCFLLSRPDRKKKKIGRSSNELKLCALIRDFTSPKDSSMTLNSNGFYLQGAPSSVRQTFKKTR